MKLVKEEKRFSAAKRPKVGRVVAFSHARHLFLNYWEKTHLDFPQFELVDGQKGTVVENTKYLTYVKFAHDTLLISPEFLIVQELSKEGKKAMDILNRFVMTSERTTALENNLSPIGKVSNHPRRRYGIIT